MTPAKRQESRPAARKAGKVDYSQEQEPIEVYRQASGQVSSAPGLGFLARALALALACALAGAGLFWLGQALAWLALAGAACALAAGLAVLGWRGLRAVDTRKIELARAGAELKAIDVQTQIALIDARTRQLAAYKIKSGARESLFIPGTGLIVAPLDHAPAANVPHSYNYRQEISHAPALAAPGLPALASGHAVTGVVPFAASWLDQIPRDSLLMTTGIIAESGEPDILHIHNASQILYTGRSGQGKSTACALLLMSALARNSAARLKVWLLDIEGITAAPFAPYAHRLERTPAGIIKALKELAVMVDDRAELLASGALKLKSLPDYHLVFIEEALKLTLVMSPEQEKEYLNLLMNLAISSRKTGIYLIFSIQTMRANGNKPLAIIRDQCNLKVSGALAKAFMINSLEYDDDDALEKICKDKQPGQFIRMIGGTNALIRVPYFELDELSAVLPPLMAHRTARASGQERYKAASVTLEQERQEPAASWPALRLVAPLDPTAATSEQAPGEQERGEVWQDISSWQQEQEPNGGASIAAQVTESERRILDAYRTARASGQPTGDAALAKKLGVTSWSVNKAKAKLTVLGLISNAS